MKRCQAVKGFILGADEVIICAAAAPCSEIDASGSLQVNLCHGHKVIHDLGITFPIDMNFNAEIRRPT
jgi:hypothetical protein